MGGKMLRGNKGEERDDTSNSHFWLRHSATVIPRLHDEAGSTSWLNVCSTSARCLLDDCLTV